jgi:hypothetical protein
VLHLVVGNRPRAWCAGPAWANRTINKATAIPASKASESFTRSMPQANRGSGSWFTHRDLMRHPLPTPHAPSAHGPVRRHGKTGTPSSRRSSRPKRRVLVAGGVRDGRPGSSHRLSPGQCRMWMLAGCSWNSYYAGFPTHRSKRCRRPTCGAARPTPPCWRIKANISSATSRSVLSNVSTGSQRVRRIVSG